MHHSKESADTKIPGALCHSDTCKPNAELFHSPTLVSGVASIVLITSITGCTKVVSERTDWDLMSVVVPANDNTRETCLDDDVPPTLHCL